MSALLGMQMQQQRVAVVGVGGIGLPAAAICAELGADLILAGPEAPREAAEDVRARYGVQATARVLDVASPERIAEFCADEKNLDALIITAGVLPDEHDMEPGSGDWLRSFEDVYNVNVRGPMLLAQLAMRNMIERSGGRIVIVGSLAGRSGGVLSGAQYASSKGALHTLVRWLALRAAPHGVCVNGIAPGVTRTPMIDKAVFDLKKIPAGRVAEPVEIARAVAFLASPAASYMHGAVVDVNGGVAFS